MPHPMKCLQDTKIVSLALNAPGPAAAMRLVRMGAECIKIEPPSGDLLKSAAPAWYAELIENQKVVSLDLKTAVGREQLHHFLSHANLLLTSFRPSALQRLGVDWETLHAKYPRLCMVSIIGYPVPEQEVPGHDLTYQAKLGLLQPPEMPVAELQLASLLRDDPRKELEQIFRTRKAVEWEQWARDRDLPIVEIKNLTTDEHR